MGAATWGDEGVLPTLKPRGDLLCIGHPPPPFLPHNLF